MKKVWFSILAFFLSALMAFYAIPATALEELVNTDTNTSVTEIETEDVTFEPEDSSTEETHLFENTELREASVKHFRLNDGSYLAAQYPYTVHTKDENGNWQDIDNTLHDSNSDFSTINARIKFAKKTTGNETLFTLQDGKYKITMSLNGANKKVAGTVTNDEDAESNTDLQKMLHLEKLSSSIIYPDILDGVDLEYVVNSLNVKENIIVKERQDSYSYSFTLKLNNLSATLNEEGSVDILDPDTPETVYRIPSPVVYDAKGIYADPDKASYSLTDCGNGKYTLTVTANTEWMNAEDRTFPVTVDPTVYVNLFNDMSDNFVSSASADKDFSDNAVMYAGHGNIGQEYITYWKPDSLPTLPTNAYITSACLEIFMTEFVNATSTAVSEVLLGVYNVTSSWTPPFKWNDYSAGTMGAIGTLFECVRVTSDNNESYIPFDITYAVRQWYAGTTNYGVAIKHQSTDRAYANFESTNNQDNMPRMTIQYKVQKGLESYWTYSSHSVGNAGTGQINLATGDLTFTLPTLSTTDGLFGFTPTLVYNSADAAKYNTYANNTNVPYVYPSAGYGWRLNVNETVAEKTYTDKFGNENTVYYIWTDGDGTEHAFYITGNGFYQDEDGLIMTLAANNTEITITDSSHNVRHFKVYSADTTSIKKGAVLQSITDKFGNALTFTLNNKGQVTAIGVTPNGLSTIPYLTLTYNTAGCITEISGIAGHKVSFQYSTTYSGTESSSNGGYLRSATFSQTTGSTTTVYDEIEYTYSSDSYLRSPKDVTTENEIRYYYENGDYYRIRHRIGGSYSQEGLYTYGSGTTTVRSSGKDDVINNDDDILTHYTFDGAGRAISTYSSNVSGNIIYGATTGNYSDEAQNKLKSTAVSGGSPVNYIVNSNFEMSASALSYWYKTSNVTKSISLDTFESHASISVKASTTDRIFQYVKLPNGTYTLSANISTKNCSNVAIYLKVTDVSSGTEVSKEIPASENVIDSEISPDFTFEVNSDSGYANYCIAIEAVGGASVESNAYVTVDDVMLEKGIGSSQNSVVRLGGFDASSITNGGTTRLAPENAWAMSSTGTISSTAGITGAGAYITGSLTKKQSFSQTINILPASFWENNTFTPLYDPANFYMFSGFAKGTHQVSSGFFGFKVTATYYTSYETDSVITAEFEFPCNNSVTEYQFVSGLVVIPYGKFVKSIKVQCVYDNNPGTAYFDNISLVPLSDSSAAQYTYTTEGFVSTCITPESETYYSYLWGNLVREATDNGDVIKYTYGDYDELISKGTGYYVIGNANSTEDILHTFTDYTYNTYGLVTRTHTYAENDPDHVVRTTATYDTSSGSINFGKALTQTDENGNTTRFVYNSNTGQLNYQINPDGASGLYYAYDSIGRLQKVTPLECDTSTNSYSSIENAEFAEYTYNALMQLSDIDTATTNYSFVYDTYGNTTEIYAGNYLLASYTYGPNNGKLASMTYGNGTTVNYSYDALDRIEKISYNNTVRYEYQYTSDGKLHSVTDIASGVGYLYEYDSEDRLSGYVEYKLNSQTNTLSIKYNYNKKNQLTKSKITQDYTYGTNSKTLQWVEEYFYNEENNLLEELYIYSDISLSSTSPSDVTINYTYDDLQRLSQKLYTVEGDSTFTNTVNITYNDQGNRLKPEISQYSTQTGSYAATTYTYTYDAKGNITKIVDNAGKVTKYTYDDVNQLIREDNPYLNKSYVFAYDNNGNRTSRKIYAYTTGTLGEATTTTTYTHGDSTWGDRLTKYNSSSITYDEIGNPLHYYNGFNYNFTWSDGRRLATATRSGVSYSFTYNDEGIRTSKTVGGVKHTYTLDGSQIVSEQWGNYFIAYIYDESGAPIGMHYRTNSMAANVFETYYFEKNLQGDVIAVYNASGTKLAGYKYDAWGNCTTTYYNGGGSTGAQYNPFRYRGYYYDTGLEFYYLNSRYYDFRTGRFINADDHAVIGATPDALTDKNLYTYCDNNPVMRQDEDGEFWNIIAGAVIGGGLELAGQLLSGKSISEVNWAKVGVSALSGGLTAAVGPIAGSLISGATDVAMCALDGNINSVADVAESFVRGTVKAVVSYGVGTAVGKATKSLTKIEKVGKIGVDGYPGVKYSYNKGQGRAVRSIELHPNHNNHGIHLQGNKWNPQKDTRSGVFFRKTIWR